MLALLGGATHQLAATLGELRAADLRLARIGYHLTVANAPLCDDLMPGTGLILHALDQYADGARPLARDLFGFPSPVAVQGIVPGSPAEAADIEPGDGVAAVNGVSLPPGKHHQSSDTRDQAEATLAALPPSRPITLSLMRQQRPVTATLAPYPSCRVRLEVAWEASVEARSDGATIQVGYGSLRGWSDEELAVVVAHELAHAILRHRARLDTAKVSKGLFAGLGRSGRLNRQAEDEADRLSVHLLHNAGFDPFSAARFWQKPENRGELSLLSGHPSPARRAARLTAEAAGLPRSGPSLSPSVLARRLEPIG